MGLPYFGNPLATQREGKEAANCLVYIYYWLIRSLIKTLFQKFRRSQNRQLGNGGLL